MSEGAVGRDLSCKLRRGGIVGGGRALLGETGEYIKTQGIVNSSRDYTAVDDSRREWKWEVKEETPGDQQQGRPDIHPTAAATE